MNVDRVDFIKVEIIGPLWITFLRRTSGILEEANNCFSVVKIVVWLSKTVICRKMEIVRSKINRNVKLDSRDMFIFNAKSLP